MDIDVSELDPHILTEGLEDGLGIDSQSMLWGGDPAILNPRHSQYGKDRSTLYLDEPTKPSWGFGDYEDVDAWYNPTTWFDKDDHAADKAGGYRNEEAERSVLAEIKSLGRVKTTCIIRRLNTLALDYLDMKKVAEKKGRHDIAEDCVEKRATISATNDWLYWMIDYFLGGEWGKEALVPSNACFGMKAGRGRGGRPIDLGSFDDLAEPVTISVAVIGVITAGGVLAFLAYLFADFKAKGVAMGVCVDTDDIKKCEAAVGLAKAGPLGPLADVLKWVAIPAGLMIGAGIFLGARKRAKEKNL